MTERRVEKNLIHIYLSNTLNTLITASAYMIKSKRSPGILKEINHAYDRALRAMNYVEEHDLSWRKEKLTDGSKLKTKIVARWYVERKRHRKKGLWLSIYEARRLLGRKVSPNSLKSSYEPRKK